MKNILKISAIVLVIVSFSGSVNAAPSTTGTANVRVATPLSVSAGTALEFGNFASGATTGTITQAGAVTGGVTALTGGATRAAGTFSVTGEGSASTPYTFTLPSTATLANGANNMTATLSFATGTSSRTLTSGADSVSINGSLAVAANQAAGAYTGTYTVSVAY